MAMAEAAQWKSFKNVAVEKAMGREAVSPFFAS
jgi:hypothetical protein